MRLSIELPDGNVVCDVFYDCSTVVMHVKIVRGGEDGD